MARISSATRFFVLAALLLTGISASAQTRTEHLEWSHSDPTDRVGYIVYFGTASRSYSQQVDVGLPPLVSTVYSADVVVPDSGEVYFAVTAYDASRNESAYSNEIVRGTASGGTGDGGTTSPPTDSGTANAAIAGFRLMDGATGEIIDNDFVSGDTIDSATEPCVAIEIVGNSYLSTWNQPGSIKTVFDGQDRACDAAPLSHENNPPYAWESESDCAPTLRTPGAHQLIAIPYDGDDCTGAMGAAMNLDFEVIDSADSGTDTTLGAPGQPHLVP